jgi:rhodanese-related sulfurtransferase
VVALRNGTMGWELAGFACAHGRTDSFPPGPPRTAALALKRAQAFAEKAGVGVIGPVELAAFVGDPARTTYVLDVRDPAEYAAAHLSGSISAPGGQLVQATDKWIGVRGARIALVDDDGVRARMTGAWLRMMGHRDVFVVEGGLLAAALPPRPLLAPPKAETIDADRLAAVPDALVIDLATSIEFRDGHVCGAIWGVRSRLDGLREKLGRAKLVVLTSPDGALARLAVPEVRALTHAPVRVLDGGTAAWVRAAQKLQKDRTTPPDEACVDFYLRPYDRNSGVEEAMKAYLSWEIDLVHEIERDGTVHFGV